MGLVFFRGGNLVVKLNENPVEKVESGVEMVVFEWRMSKSEGGNGIARLCFAWLISSTLFLIHHHTKFTKIKTKTRK